MKGKEASMGGDVLLQGSSITVPRNNEVSSLEPNYLRIWDIPALLTEYELDIFLRLYAFILLLLLLAICACTRWLVGDDKSNDTLLIHRKQSIPKVL
jgi:hypothetical protein